LGGIILFVENGSGIRIEKNSRLRTDLRGGGGVKAGKGQQGDEGE
jgi:hypothetical protein